MKNKTLSLASLLAVFNLNAIEIGPTGSGVEMGGFVDYSAVSQGDVTSPVSTAQVELNLDFSTGPVSFSLDYDLTATQGLADADGDGTLDSTSGNLEEAVVTYAITDSLSFSVGRMLSYLGFEAFDAPNMYQFSYAYDYATGGQDIYDAYADGFSVDYASDMFSVGVWTDFAEHPSFEYAFAFTGIENLTAKAIFADYGDDADDIMTLWASYELDKLLLAVEFATDEKNTAAPGTAADFTDDDIDAFLIMANYAVTDSAALTVRFSTAEYSDGATSVDVDKFTVSPSYAFTDNFSGLIEYSSYSVSGGAAEPEDLTAIELIYTF
ncbi:MAG: hypothetical protein VX467_07555 [Verrucomicrobiota bacterium]|nr:hypothetical protein [Verrucomicrobiota bacterium]MEC8244294.1 hypothetical protein [Verrucomicrobiota bacterium]